MWRSPAIGPGRVPHGRCLPVVMAVAAAGLAACGDDGGGANSAATTRRTTSTDRATRSEKIVIREHANLQDVVDKGEVLSGSSLGGEAFCQGGNESGVGAGFVAAQSMVEVKDDQAGDTEFPEDVEEADGVRSARDGDPQPAHAGQQAAALDGVGDALDQAPQRLHCTAGILASSRPCDSTRHFSLSF